MSPNTLDILSSATHPPSRNLAGPQQGNGKVWSSAFRRWSVKFLHRACSFSSASSQGTLRGGHPRFGEVVRDGLRRDRVASAVLSRPLATESTRRTLPRVPQWGLGLEGTLWRRRQGPSARRRRRHPRRARSPESLGVATRNGIVDAPTQTALTEENEGNEVVRSLRYLCYLL